MPVTMKARPGPAQSLDEDFLDRLIDDWHREAPDLNVEAMAVVGRILRLSNLLYKSANELFRKHQLTYSEFDILATLRRSGGSCSMKPSELATAVLLTSGAITAALDRLEAKELIVRKFDQSDRRSVRVTLTPRGKKLAEVLAAIRFEDARATLDCLTAREANIIANGLKKITNAIEKER